MTIVLLSKREAVSLTKRILNGIGKMDAEAIRIAPLLAEAKEREIWRVYGLTSWQEYVHTELGMSRSRSYQLLDLVRAETALSEAVGAPVTVMERTVRPLKARLTDVGVQARKHRDEGMQPQLAVDVAVAEARRELPITRQRISDGGGYADEYDSGEAVYRCRHCQRTGTVATLSRCLELVREQQDDWGA